MNQQTNVFTKEAGHVYGNTGNGVVELGRFASTDAKVSLVNTFRKSGYKVDFNGNDLIVSKQ